MIYKIEVKEQAREDLAQAAIWYEEQSSGLGERFIKEFKVVTERIKQSPLSI